MCEIIEDEGGDEAGGVDQGEHREATAQLGRVPAALDCVILLIRLARLSIRTPLHILSGCY